MLLSITPILEMAAGLNLLPQDIASMTSELPQLTFPRHLLIDQPEKVEE